MPNSVSSVIADWGSLPAPVVSLLSKLDERTDSLTRDFHHLKQNVEQMTKTEATKITQADLTTAMKTHIETCPTAQVARNIEEMLVQYEHSPHRQDFLPATLQGWLAVVIMVGTLLGFLYAGITWQAKITATQEYQMQTMQQLQDAIKSMPQHANKQNIGG